MQTKWTLAVVTLVLVTACGQGSHGTAVLKAEPSATPTDEPTAAAIPTLAPTPTEEPTRAPTHAPTPRATAAPTHALVAKPTVSPTPVDTRPTATVVVHNRASMTVKGVVGDFDFVLASGQSSSRMTVHVDPGGNTGVGVARADDAGCGEGGPKYLKAGHSYTLTLTDGGTCAPDGTAKPSPSSKLTED